MAHELRFRLDPLEIEMSIAKAEKLCARASKKGLSGGYSVVGVETTTISSEDDFGNEVAVQIHELVIVGEPIKYEGWTFVAVVEWLEGKPFVSKVPSYEGPEVGAETLIEGACDHCSTSRRRKQVVIVEKDGVRKSVGSTCVKDFLGWQFNASYLTDPTSTFEDSFGGYGGFSGTDTKHVLAVAVAIVEQEGWKSRSAAQFGGGSTADAVNDYLYGKSDYSYKFRRRIGAPTAAHYAEAARLLDWIQSWTAQGDYAANLKVAASLEFTGSKTLGTLISVIGTEGRDRAVAAEKAAATAKLEGFTEARYAEDGTKIELEAKVLSKRWYEGTYGPIALVIFAADGYRFQWWGTAACIQELNEGATVFLKGTVKGVKEHEDKTYTVLTRCKTSVLETAA